MTGDEVRGKSCLVTDGCVWLQQRQQQIWCYRNSYQIPPRRLTFMGIWKQTACRTSQAAPVPTNQGYRSLRREAKWLSHDVRSLFFCSTKQKTCTSSWPSNHWRPCLSCTRTCFFGVLYRQRMPASSVLWCIFSYVRKSAPQRSRQTVEQMCPVSSQLSSSDSD